MPEKTDANKFSLKCFFEQSKKTGYPGFPYPMIHMKCTTTEKKTKKTPPLNLEKCFH